MNGNHQDLNNPSQDVRSDRADTRSAHVEQLIRILTDQEDTCHQLAACAREQQNALRQGDGPGFVRASLTQAHLARRLYFLEEERNAAVSALAHFLSQDPAEQNTLVSAMKRLPETEAERLADRARRLQSTAEDAAAVQKVNAQMIQTNIQVAAALTRQMVHPSEGYYTAQAGKDRSLPSHLDHTI